MARRKLVKQGAATYTTSLPKEWIERFNLKSGDEIDIEESGTQLIISSVQKQKKYETLTFNLEKLPSDLSKEFAVSLYKGGVKDAALINLNKDQSDRIKAVSSATIGLEIISQEKNKLELLDLSSADEESLLKAEKQIFWRLLHMLDTILDKKTTDLEIKLIDYEINKLTFFIQRNLATKFSSNPKNFLLYEKVSVLESLGDSLRSLKIYSRDIDEKFIKKIYNILDLLKSDNLENNNLIAIKSEMFHLRKLSEQKQNKKENDSLAYILIYKNLKQIFDITFTMNIRKIIA